jgi:DNA-directed RNA polymerase subunit RPC12/RpoP
MGSLATEQCIGCGEDVVVRRASQYDTEGDVRCPKCRSATAGHRRKKAAERLRNPPPAREKRWVDCPTCGGFGTVGHVPDTRKCPDCGGKGIFDRTNLPSDAELAALSAEVRKLLGR